MILRLHRLAGRLRPRGDDGSMAFFLVIAIVGLAIAALLTPMIVTSSRVTRSDTSRVHALDAAQAGINVMVGKIRAAKTDGVVGTSTLLPCQGTSGRVASAGNATYNVSVDYYMSDPVTVPGAQKMTCLNGYGTYDPISDTFTPKFARITSVGKDGAASNGSTAGRTLATTYVFKTSNTNIVGGRIQIGAAADATSLLCMDAGSAAPLAAATIKLQVCATPPKDQQIFAYRSDLTLQLLSSISGTYPNGLCVDTAPPPASGGAVVLNVCAVLGSPPYTQQWSYNDNGGYSAALPTSAADGGLSGQCITVSSQTAGTPLTLAGCGGASQGWIPSPVVGAGAAQAPQLVNFYEFGRCLDVTNADVRSDHLIDFPCKQNPFPGAVLWNQKFTTPGIPAGATSAVGQIVTTPSSSNYCLTSPGTEAGYVTVTPCSATNARQVWTVYNGNSALQYSQKYTVVDNTGRCLGAYAPKGGETWSAPDVRACTGDTKQKWNATADLATSTLRDLNELPVSTPSAATAWEALRTKPSWRFTLLILAIGMGLFSGAITDTVTNHLNVPLLALLAVPLIALVAYFPIVIEERDAAIEIGFESAVLMLLLCTLQPPVAHLVWSLGVILTQAISRKRLSAWTFNVGTGILAGALATGIFDLTRGPGVATPRELVAVLLAATAYFLTDYLLTGVSLALDSGTSVREHVVGGGSWLAICCFVPFDMLGYLGAILLRSTPAWSLILLVVPLVTLLVATRAVTRGRENARRLQVLLDAAVDSQTLSEPQQVVEALVSFARRLLGMQDLDVRDSAPRATEIGAYVRGREDPLWIVAPARSRARSTTKADQQALSALAAVSSASFSRLELTEDLVHLARYDPLTDLPNRAVFLDRLHFSLHQARRRGKNLALLFVDLDGFKPINDRFGHAAGDAVLIDVAKRLRASVRDEDTVARLGGDEFAVLFEDIELHEVTAACRRILSTLSGGVDADDHTVNVGASIGIVYGAGEDSADDMLRNADLAMYEAKARGKDQYVVYQPRMLTSRLDRLELVEALEHALDTGALTLAYQPVIVAATGHISGVEALCRWRHEGVDMRPDVFIAVAEETGLIAALGAVVLDTVARDAPAIRRAAGSPISVAVNVSPTQLTRPEFVDIVEETVGRMAGLSLTLEITEREGISHDAGVLGHMQTISEMGVGFAIDDFGVGFSSISYLQEVPARTVKVDATLSRDIDHDPKARGLLRSITMMSQALGLDVVVEGVERESQLALVRQDVPGAYAQGYFMHRPMPLAQLLDVLAANREETMSRLLATPPRL